MEGPIAPTANRIPVLSSSGECLDNIEQYFSTTAPDPNGGNRRNARRNVGVRVPPDVTIPRGPKIIPLYPRGAESVKWSIIARALNSSGAIWTDPFNGEFGESASDTLIAHPSGLVVARLGGPCFTRITSPRIFDFVVFTGHQVFLDPAQ